MIKHHSLGGLSNRNVPIIAVHLGKAKIKFLAYSVPNRAFSGFQADVFFQGPHVGMGQ